MRKILKLNICGSFQLQFVIHAVFTVNDALCKSTPKIRSAAKFTLTAPLLNI